MLTLQETYILGCSRTQTLTVWSDGKWTERRVRIPKYWAATVYSMPSTHVYGGKLWGWSRNRLENGQRAIPFPVLGTFETLDDAWRAATWLNALIDWAVHYGDGWNGGTPIQIGWDGEHRGRSVTIDGCTVEMHGCGDAVPPGPSAYGNLAWAWIRGISYGVPASQRYSHTVRCLVDLEDLHVDRKAGEVYVGIVHTSEQQCYGGGTYSDYVERWENPRAKALIDHLTKN